MGNYHDLYTVFKNWCTTDSWYFLKIREQSLKTYRLDPAWYFTLPGLAWDTMLIITKIKLDKCMITIWY